MQADPHPDRHNDNELTALLEALQHGNQLKRTIRTGWAQRGIAQPENVAAHSYGVAYTALMLAHFIDVPFDMGKLLTMALLHDLPEGLTSDIPSPAWQFLPAEVKPDTERRAMQHILGQASFAPELLDLWEELTAGEVIEAKVIHDADRLELYLQAANYEEETGNTKLSEFWRKEPTFFFTASVALFQKIKQRIR